MATTAAAGHVATEALLNTGHRSGLPWYLWCASAAVTSAIIGGLWDISWHESIGRDTFWTPAHIAIYMCGVLAGIAYGYLILSTTFSAESRLESSSVRILGLRGPLGAFIASWGGIAMLTSAPFDNWWHDAYGLDVEILSPPHVVLFIGVYAILAGTLVLIAGYMNRAVGLERKAARNLYLVRSRHCDSCGRFSHSSVDFPHTAPQFVSLHRTFHIDSDRDGYHFSRDRREVCCYVHFRILHAGHDCADPDSAAFPGRTEAGSGVSARHAFRSAALSATPGCSGNRARPVLERKRAMERVEAGGLQRRAVPSLAGRS